MTKNKIILSVCMLFITATVWAQGMPGGYNPFVSANLNDPVKLTEITVVESSFHKYKISGDQNFTVASTFVWYVENGTLGTYDPNFDMWTPLAGTASISNGSYAEISGTSVDGVKNSSEIWVRWNDSSGGSTGYIAVYERSSTNCIVDNQIAGYKHRILSPPEVWFTVGQRLECADQQYTVEVQFKEIDASSYPYTLTYSYPDLNGQVQTVDRVLNDGDISATLGIFIDMEVADAVSPNADQTYTLNLLELRDKYGSLGKIAPLGAASSQYSTISITTYHLPKTGGMTMD